MLGIKDVRYPSGFCLFFLSYRMSSVLEIFPVLTLQRKHRSFKWESKQTGDPVIRALMIMIGFWTSSKNTLCILLQPLSIQLIYARNYDLMLHSFMGLLMVCRCSSVAVTMSKMKVIKLLQTLADESGVGSLIFFLFVKGKVLAK